MSASSRPVTVIPVRRGLAVAATALSLAVAATGCTSSGASKTAADEPSSSASASSSPSPTAAPVSVASVATNVVNAAAVKVDKVLTLTAKKGTFDSVEVKTGKTSVRGALSADKASWTSKTRLEPGTRYHVKAVAVDSKGLKTVKRSSFRTQVLDRRTQEIFPSFAPVSGETVGIGMPVIVRFDRPVANRAAFQKHLTVTNSSHQKGAWHWLSDYEVHWRPAHYWKPGTDVTVKADINSIAAGDGMYGQLSRTSTFHVGRSVISHVNAASHQLQTFIDGKLARTIPITTGKAGFTTRSGTKVIIEKNRHKRMNSETIGIATNSANGYDLDDVEYAMRLTYSGEFLHAAPWSVGSQGYANVSHGCTGMSTSNAAWLYANSKPGDVVEYTGTDRPMSLDNGYGDWNESFAAYQRSTTAG